MKDFTFYDIKNEKKFFTDKKVKKCKVKIPVAKERKEIPIEEKQSINEKNSIENSKSNDYVYNGPGNKNIFVEIHSIRQHTVYSDGFSKFIEDHKPKPVLKVKEFHPVLSYGYKNTRPIADDSYMYTYNYYCQNKNQVWARIRPR